MEKTSAPARGPHMHPALPYVVGVLSGLVLVAGYLVLANGSGFWPYQPPQPSATTTPSSTPLQSHYRNTQYGFEISLPTSWKGYTVTVKKWNGIVFDAAGNQTGTDTGTEVVLLYPGTDAAHPHEAMPILVFTPSQWALVSAGDTNPAQPFMSVSAAPFGPSELGHNSHYVLALPARYNYDYQPGWEEVDQLVHTLKTFEPNSVPNQE